MRKWFVSFVLLCLMVFGSLAASTTSVFAAANTATPAASSASSLIKLSNILNRTVTTSDGTKVGVVSAVLLERPAANLPSGLDGVNIRYLMVDTGSGSLRIAVVPFSAINWNSAGSLKLTVRAATLNAAPRTTRYTLMDENGENNVSKLYTAANAYWTQQGISVSAVSGPMFLIFNATTGTSVVDAQGNLLGTAVDAYVNRQTGGLAYLVFNAGTIFANKTFFLPARALSWDAAGLPAQLSNAGQYMLRVSNTLVNSAPSQAIMSSVQLDDAAITSLNQYWQAALAGLK